MMTMRRSFITAMALLLIALVIGVGVYAIEPQPGNASTALSPDKRQDEKREERRREERLKEEREKMEAAAHSNEWEIEFGTDLKPIKGAPFSAQVIIENAQTLANGVYISHKETGALYRDSEGRTRRDMPSNGTPEVVVINDPIANVLYKMNVHDHKALKVMYGGPGSNRESSERREMEEREIEHKNRAEESSQYKTESLGAQMIEGVKVEGKRMVVTVPAGREGNDRAFEIVSEQWYSPDLKVVVMSKHSDPRRGELIYQLTGISRNEPSRSVFEPSQDFTIREEKVERRKQY